MIAWEKTCSQIRLHGDDTNDGCSWKRWLSRSKPDGIGACGLRAVR